MENIVRPKLGDYALLALLSAIWGSSFLLIKIAVVSIPGVPLTALRLFVAASVLVVITLGLGHKFPHNLKVWALMAMVAIFGNALPFSLISWGEEVVDSALAAILMAVMPLTTVLLAHIFTDDEKLNRWKLAGVIIGMAGLIVLVGPDQLSGLGSDLGRQVAIGLAAVCYGVSTLFIRHIKNVPQLPLTAGVVGLSAIIMLPVSFYFFPLSSFSPANSALVATITLGVIQTALANFLAFSIIRKLGATFFSQLNFFVPLFGVLFGFVFLGEKPGVFALLALGIILFGVSLARYGIMKSVK